MRGMDAGGTQRGRMRYARGGGSHLWHKALLPLLAIAQREGDVTYAVEGEVLWTVRVAEGMHLEQIPRAAARDAVGERAHLRWE